MRLRALVALLVVERFRQAALLRVVSGVRPATPAELGEMGHVSTVAPIMAATVSSGG